MDVRRKLSDLALTTLRLAPALALAMGLAVGLLAVVRMAVPFEVLQKAEGIGDFLQALASVEAVLLAFVVFMVWQQFDDTRREVELEANELLDLVRVSRGMPEPYPSVIRELVQRYAELVIGQEWAAMRRGDERAMAVTWQVLDEMWSTLQRCEPDGACAELHHAQALDRLNDLSDARANRLSSARRHMPRSLKVLVHAGATAVVLAGTLLPIESFALHACIVAGLAAAVSHVLWVIADLDDPFDGDWQVPMTAFERVLERLAATAQGDQRVA